MPDYKHTKFGMGNKISNNSLFEVSTLSPNTRNKNQQKRLERIKQVTST